MATDYIRLALLVSATLRDHANALAAVFDPDVGGAATFGAVAVTVNGQQMLAADTLMRAANFSILQSCIANQAVPGPLRGDLTEAEALNVLNSATIVQGQALQQLCEQNGWGIAQETE